MAVRKQYGVGCERNEGESWRDVVERMAGKYGLEHECLAIFNREIRNGSDEGRAALTALSEWDCLDFYVNGKKAKAGETL